MSFTKAIASSGYHVYRITTWRRVEVGQKIIFAYETREEALNIDQYSIAVQIFPQDRIAPVTVGHIPMELSRFVYYFMQRGGGLSGRILSTRYKRSAIPEGGLEIPISLKFQHPD